MPRVSAFYGIVIAMFWNEGAHARPHFHARYADFAATVAFDGTTIAGGLPPRAQAMVSEWARLHAPELALNWERARRLEPIAPIEPLP